MGRKGEGGCCRGVRISTPWLREFMAELLGTFILITFGNASVAQSVLSLGNKGDFFSVNWGWGLGVMLGVLVSGGVSGGHLNPAVTVAMATLGKLPWRKVPHYLAAQYTAGFLASAVVFLVYWDALVWYEHDRGAYRTTPDTAAIFATYPSPHLTYPGGIADQLIGTALLLLSICAITDRKNMQVSRQLVPLFVGLTVLAIGICFGFNCGYAINPARDFAPRLFTALTGWGLEVFTFYNHWWVVPIIATHVGAIIGAWIYYIAVEINWPKEDEDLLSEMARLRQDPTYIQYPHESPTCPEEEPEQERRGLTQPDARPSSRQEFSKAAFQDELRSKMNK